jgi:hypothetical protein
VIKETATSKPVLEREKTGSLALQRAAIIPWLLALAFLALGLGIRLYDVTDQPLDFHPTRQLRSALVARSMYYEMLPGADPALREDAADLAARTGRYEPPILERLAALSYLLLGGENLWVARILSSVFWIIGGLGLFALARRMTAGLPAYASTGAALVALCFYLFLPFAYQASRTFQPDPWMVMWIVLAALAFYRWSETASWKWAVLAGTFGGAAVVVKAVAAYFIAGAAVGIVLYTLGLRRSLRSLQVWAMALLIVAPSVLLYLVDNQARASEYFTSWTLALSHLLLQPGTYARWLSLVQDLTSMGALLAGLVGMLIAPPRSRSLLVGLWAGYLLYGLFLPYQMYTHNYYHLPLIPVLGLSIAPAAAVVLDRISQQGRLIQLLSLGILLVGVAYPAATSLIAQKVDDNRHEPAYWVEIASYLPRDGKIIGLTQDYGFRLMYYGWRKVDMWPNRGERNLAVLRGKDQEFEKYFENRAGGRSYFLITAFGQYRDQPDLQELLEERYPVYAEGDGYLIFDLEHPLQ